MSLVYTYGFKQKHAVFAKSYMMSNQHQLMQV